MRRLWYLLISVAFIGGCRGPATEGGPPDKLPTSKYIRRTNAETVIVFVPGMLGDPVATWTNDTTHAYWPELLTKDPVFRDSDVFTYSYSSARTQSLDEIVSDFNLRLSESEVFAAHKRVVFICHSLGGSS